jgi:hypothetical protein
MTTEVKKRIQFQVEKCLDRNKIPFISNTEYVIMNPGVVSVKFDYLLPNNNIFIRINDEGTSPNDIIDTFGDIAANLITISAENVKSKLKYIALSNITNNCNISYWDKYNKKYIKKSKIGSN